MQYENRKGAKFDCPYCEESKKGKPKTLADFRLHMKARHKDIPPPVYERYLVQQRYPTLDIDALVQRYVDRLETMIGLQYQGLFIKKFLNIIGVARSAQADKVLMGILKRNPDCKTAEDVTRAYANRLVHTFRNASPEVRFQGYLNRENSKLEKNGHAELIEPITALKTIKFIREQLQEARQQAVEPDTEETEAEST